MERFWMFKEEDGVSEPERFGLAKKQPKYQPWHRHVKVALIYLKGMGGGGYIDHHTTLLHFTPSPLLITSVLWAKGAVVGAVAALLAEVDVGTDAALQQGLGGPGVVTHAQEDLVGLILAEEPQGVHLWRKERDG